MARKNIFMEKAFWDKFSECSLHLNPYEEGGDPALTFEKASRWHSFFRFFCRSSIFMDSSLAELGRQAGTDQMLKYLLKCNSDGKMDLEEAAGEMPNLDSNAQFECEEDYESIYFTEADHRGGARNHGVLNINMDNLWEHNKKFQDFGMAVRENEDWNWNRLDALRENSNSLIIVDNYILYKDYAGQCCMKDDLKTLLDKILPDTICEDYCISLFYYDSAESDRFVNINKENYTRIINDFLRAKKPRLFPRLKLELFPTRTSEESHHKDFHDRAMMTNNVWIGSEAGFDLLAWDPTRNSNHRVLKSTNIHCAYFGLGDDSAHWLAKARENLINDANKCLQKYHYTSINRLLQTDTD